MQFMLDCAVRVMKYRGSSFDENESALVIPGSGLEVAVGFRVKSFIKEGTLQVVSGRTITGSAETFSQR